MRIIIITVIEVGQDSVNTLHSKLRGCAERTRGKTQEGKVSKTFTEYFTESVCCLLRLNMLVSDVQAAMFSSRRLSAVERKSSVGYSFVMSERKSSYLSAATLPFYRAESVKKIFSKI